MSHVLASPSVDSLYDRDLALWSQEQALLLEQRRFAELDLQNLIDEVKSVGSFDRREIRNRLEVLIALAQMALSTRTENIVLGADDP